MALHIIYTQDGVPLSKETYTSWREIQEEFFSYKASLGPWTAEEVIGFLADEYANLISTAKEQIDAFIQSDKETCKLTFAEPQ